MPVIIERVETTEATACPPGYAARRGSARRGPSLRAAFAGRRGEIMGVIWVVFWLVFLVPELASAARTDLLGLAFLLVGAVGYAAGCWQGFASLYSGRGTAVPPAAAAVTLVATFGAVWRLGVDGLGLLPYLGVATVCALPLRIAWPLIALAMAAGAGYVHLGGEEQPTGLYSSVAFASLATGMGFAATRRDITTKRLQSETHELEIQDERNRMARDLHDILGHSLTVISLKADLAGKLVDRDTEAAKRELAELQSLARSALADVRATVNNYREVSLSGELVRARGALSDAGIRAELPTAVDDVDPELRELFAWALREATTNIVRHSGATRCTVTLDRERLAVTDDGRGPTGPSDGNGLDGLRERARRAGAIVETGPSATGTTDRPGFTLVVREAS